MKRGLVLLVILFSLSFVSAVDDANIFGHKMTEIAWGDGSTCSSGVITGISSSGTAACGVSTANSLAALDGTPAQAVYVDNDGRVGIGMTAPDVPLSVAGNVRALNFIGPEDIQFGIYTNKDYSSGAAIQFYGINGDIPNSMYFMTGSTLTERVRIDSDGNVGIGTTDPGAYKLNVAGNTKISGNLDVTGTISGGDSGGFVPSTYAGGESVTFPNGLIMKNGKTNSIAIGGSEAITFSSPFPNATLNIVVTRIEATTAASYSWSVGGENRGGFTLYNNGARAGEYYWFAIGY